MLQLNISCLKELVENIYSSCGSCRTDDGREKITIYLQGDSGDFKDMNEVQLEILEFRKDFDVNEISPIRCI